MTDSISYDVSNFRTDWDQSLEGENLVCIGCGENVMPLTMVNEAGGMTISQTDLSTLYQISRTGRSIHACTYGRKSKRGDEG